MNPSVRIAMHRNFFYYNTQNKMVKIKGSLVLWIYTQVYLPHLDNIQSKCIEQTHSMQHNLFMNIICIKYFLWDSRWVLLMTTDQTRKITCDAEWYISLKISQNIHFPKNSITKFPASCSKWWQLATQMKPNFWRWTKPHISQYNYNDVINDGKLIIW